MRRINDRTMLDAAGERVDYWDYVRLPVSDENPHLSAPILILPAIID
jgi:hypothetical protein